jgi:hypothetical protein
MVFLALSQEGLAEALRIATPEGGAVWCGADAMSEEQFASLSGSKNLTRFTYSLQDADAEVLAGALATIEEHHPRERVWVEGRRES